MPNQVPPAPLPASPSESSRFRHARAVLGVSTILMGACGIVYEYTLGALGNNLMGSSHEQLFVIIGIMLFAMGVGSAVQKKIEGQLVDFFLLLEISLGLVGGFSVLLIYIAFVYTTLHTIAMYAFASIIGVFIGVEIPLLIRINSEYDTSLKSSLSNILCMDYLGALAGALVFTYVLLTRLTIERIAFTVGIVNTLIGMAGLFYFWPLVKNRRILLALSVLIIAGLSLSTSSSGKWMGTLEQRCFRDPIILSETSPYQHVVMTKRQDRLQLFINGHLQFSSSDEQIYHELLVHTPMAAAKRQRRVLVLGGGDGLALREILKYGEVDEVDLVDLDKLMTDLAANHPELIRLNQGALHDDRVIKMSASGITPGHQIDIRRSANLPHEMSAKTTYSIAKVRVYNVDADLFLRELNNPYDVVIIDFPDPNSIELAKLYSVEFFQMLARHMTPQAVIGIQSTSPYHAKNVFLCIGKTLRHAGYKVLPYHQNVPSFGVWGWHLEWRNTV
jgi:spermidine synthase